MSKLFTFARRFLERFLVSLVFAFSALAILPPPPALAAGGVCTDAFSGPLSHKIPLVSVKSERSLQSGTELEARLRALQSELSPNELATFNRLYEKIANLPARFTDPYSLEHSLIHEPTGSSRTVFDETFELVSILVKSHDSVTKAKAIDRWTKSEAHALLVYDYLYADGLLAEQPVYEWLLKNSLFFTDAQPVRGPPGALVTFAFEKEGTSLDITNLYKDPNVSDDDWLKLDEATRLETLKRLTDYRKHFLRASQVAPTLLKPEALGGYSQELSNAEHPGYGWEVSHKLYEFSLPRLLSEITEVSTLFRETHSFHLHVVFEMAKDYRHFDAFAVWAKHVNDYLYLRGMEEGLHGNNLTDVAEAAPTGWFAKYFDAKAVSQSRYVKTLPFKMSLIGLQSHKFFSMGLRAGLYGEAREPGMQKIGLELRDTTRKLKSLQLYAEKISHSVAEYAWEKSVDIRHLDSQTALTKDDATTLHSLKPIISDEMATRFFKAEPSVGLGLLHFEVTPYFNYQTGKLELPNPEIQQRLISARNLYETSLINLEKEIKNMNAAGTKIEEADVTTAIKMSLSEWAAKARASELYENF